MGGPLQFSLELKKHCGNEEVLCKTEKRRGREREGKEGKRRRGERRKERKGMGKRDKEKRVIEKTLKLKFFLVWHKILL